MHGSARRIVDRKFYVCSISCMPRKADITGLALRTLEDALAEAEHGPIRRQWGHRLALAWLAQTGVAEPW
jgi:hypothetical protein